MVALQTNSPVQHGDKVEDYVQRGDHRIGETQVNQEVVCDRFHLLVCRYNVNDNKIAASCHQDHEREEQDPEEALALAHLDVLHHGSEAVKLVKLVKGCVVADGRCSCC